MAEIEGRLVRCACCQSGRKSLLKREGQNVCRDCYAEVLKFRLMKACGMVGALTERQEGKEGR